MADRETGRGNRLGAYWKNHPEGVEQDAVRDRDALGSARPSRYGLSSPTNFPPARSARSPGGFHSDDNPSLYSRGPQESSPSRRPRNASSTRSAFLWEAPRPASEPRTAEPRRADAAPDPAELERLYRIATGQKEPSFADALREGPWPQSVLRRRAFPLFLVECAVYAACFYGLLDPLTVLTARLGFPLSPVFTAAGVSLAGTFACALFYPLFRDRRMLAAAWGWMAAVSALLLLLVQLLLWGEARAQWTVLRVCGFFLLGPLAANGILVCVLLYVHWRLAHPRPKPEKLKREKRAKRKKEAAADGEEEEIEDMRRDGKSRKPAGDSRNRNHTGQERNSRERDSRERNSSALDRNGWNRNLSASGRGGWERNSGWERYAQSDRNRWRQTEAERNGRRQAESVRNKWK